MISNNESIKEAKEQIAAPTDILKALLFSGLAELAPIIVIIFKTQTIIIDNIIRINENMTPNAISSIIPVISPTPV